MGLKWFIFLSNQILYLIGIWFGEIQRANIIKTPCLKEIGLRLQILITTLHLTMNTIGRTYVSSQEINNMHLDNHNNIREGPNFHPIFVDNSS